MAVSQLGQTVAEALASLAGRGSVFTRARFWAKSEADGALLSARADVKEHYSRGDMGKIIGKWHVWNLAQFGFGE